MQATRITKGFLRKDEYSRLYVTLMLDPSTSPQGSVESGVQTVICEWVLWDTEELCSTSGTLKSRETKQWQEARAGVDWKQEHRPASDNKSMKTPNFLACWEKAGLPKGKWIKALSQFYLNIKGLTRWLQLPLHHNVHALIDDICLWSLNLSFSLKKKKKIH